MNTHKYKDPEQEVRRINIIPAGNLFKVISMLSASIIIAVITGLYHGKDAVSEVQLEYQEQYTLLKSEEVSQASLDRYSQLANASIDAMQSWRRKSFELASAIILIALFILGFGASGWKNEQDRQDKINVQKTA